jgi:hypothetical protein
MTRSERRRRTDLVSKERVAQVFHNGCLPATQPPEWMYVFETWYWRKKKLPKFMGKYGFGYSHLRTIKDARNEKTINELKNELDLKYDNK